MLSSLAPETCSNKLQTANTWCLTGRGHNEHVKYYSDHFVKALDLLDYTQLIC